MLERRKDLAVEASERKELLFQICDLDEGVLEDEEAAARDYAEILELDPSNTRGFKALERLHTGPSAGAIWTSFWHVRCPYRLGE